MQPNPPPPGPVPYTPPPVPPPPRPRTNAAAARTAAALALVTAVLYVWFAFQDVLNVGGGLTGGLTGMVFVNIIGGAVGAGTVLVAAGFTYARRVAGAWTLCGLCALYAVVNTVLAPLVWGTTFSAQIDWLFGFHKSNGIAAGLATVFSLLTAVAAGTAAGTRTYAVRGSTDA